MEKKKLDFIGNKIILDKKTKKTKIFCMEDLDPDKVFNLEEELKGE